MKRVLISLVCVMLILCNACISQADETVSTGSKYYSAGVMYREWQKKNYLPDYVYGVWSTDGSSNNLTFGIPDNEAGNAGMQEIFALVYDDSTVSFVYQQYSRSYLWQIIDEINQTCKQNPAFEGTRPNEKENCITVYLSKDMQHLESTQKTARELTEKYGDAIQIEYANLITVLTQYPLRQSQRLYVFLLMTIGMSVVLMAVMGYTVRRRRLVLLMQTSGGVAAVSDAPLTNKRIVKMVKHSSPPVTSQLDKNVMDAIDGIKQ
ncbi:MAG: hypothetical protein IJE90_04900 [Clostridia bacterium]|nr:hypothetical protein [Clostridia bacterium]